MENQENNNINWNLESDMEYMKESNTPEDNPINWDIVNEPTNEPLKNNQSNPENVWKINGMEDNNTKIEQTENDKEWSFNDENTTFSDPNPENNLNSEELNEFPELDINDKDRKHTRLGMVQNINIRPTLWKLNYDNSKILEEINNMELVPLGKGPVNKPNEDGIFKLETGPGTALSELLEGIKDIGKRQMKVLSNIFIYKNGPRESTLNLFTGNPKLNWIYFVEGDFNTGDVIIDFSSLKGPINRVTESTPGIFIEIEGWIPFRITKNLSNKNLIAIGGSFN